MQFTVKDFQSPMDPCMIEWITACSNFILSTTALYSSYRLFKDHRAPSLGLFLLGISAGLSIFCPFSPHLISFQQEIEWASEVLAPALVSFGFLWLSEDHNTANILLCGSCLFVGMCDWLSSDALMLMTRCVALSSLSCSLTVSVFAGNFLGALGSAALSLSSLIDPGVGVKVLGQLVSPGANEELLKWFLKGSMSIGCWTSLHALNTFLLEAQTWY